MPDITELENDGQTSITESYLKMRQNTGGSPLSHADVDSNFENIRKKLNNTILDVNALTSGSYNLSGPTGAAGTNGTNGADGKGFTGGSYNASTGVVTFTSDDGLGFSTGDLRGADGTNGTNGSNGTGGGVTSYSEVTAIVPTITGSSGMQYSNSLQYNFCTLKRAGHFGIFGALIQWNSGTTANPTWPYITSVTTGMMDSDPLLRDGAYFTLTWPNVGIQGYGGYTLHDVKLTIWDQNSGGFFQLANGYGRATEPAWTDYDSASSSYTNSYVRVHVPAEYSGNYVSRIEATVKYMLAETEL
jgi:hypothetical protein